tara:strand:- start:10658 stop:11059 length:402 start_codon:yes stop_codon:yes gene_type:complete
MKSLKDLTTFESEYYLVPKQKAFVIKAFEKLEMVKNNPEKIGVAIVKTTKEVDENTTEYHLVLMLGTRPIAEILTHERSSFELEPDYKKSERLNEIFSQASKLEERKSEEEFDYHNSKVENFIHQEVDSLLEQ